jgi:hypothetical protein
MPRVRLTLGDLKCIRQADSFGKDDVYWIANLRSSPAVDATHTDMRKLFFDDSYATSLPEMASIAAGQTSRFKTNVIFDGNCDAGSYVYGTVHFMERDTPLANYFAKILEILGIIAGGLIIGGIVGFLIGLAFGGGGASFAGAVLGVVAVALVGFFVGAIVELTRPVESDAHLGGLKIIVGPLASPPPDSDKDVWPVKLAPSGLLEVVDQHGAELVLYSSSHHDHPVIGGHLYETSLRLEVMRGYRAATRVSPQ